tara:strand:- start:61 stop:594 length:534 start_codon:yes stop_codon:yes gene_type:complete
MKTYKKPFDPSKYKPSPAKRASHDQMKLGCNKTAQCIFSPDVLPEGVTSFGMGIRLMGAFYEYFKESGVGYRGNPERAWPSALDIHFLIELGKSNETAEKNDKGYFKMISPDRMNYKANRKIVEDAFPGLYDSVSLEKEKSKEDLANENRDSLNEIEKLKQEIALLRANQLPQQKAS